MNGKSKISLHEDALKPHSLCDYSFLPGQEAGNVDFVLDGGFGDYNRDPDQIAREIACWLQDENLLTKMSRNTKEASHPTAAADIVKDIGDLTQTWIKLNGERRSTLALAL
jgi:1,2-diacylglycerol 3-beta-galactosyltransferase